MLRRLLRFFIRPPADPAIEALYRACVMQARQADFYAALHVPDTVDGRFDVLILHVLLVMHRLDGDAKQQLFDLLFADMDRNLREMGVSDIRIAKKMKPLFAAFYGRARAYEQAFAATDEALADALRRNMYGATVKDEDVRGITTYARRAHQSLEGQNEDAIRKGLIVFPTIMEE